MDILTSLGITGPEFIVQLIGFLILIWLIAKYATGPINTLIEQRQTDIASTYDQLDADRAAMERTRKEYEIRLAGIEQEARERIQAAVKEAQELRASIISEAQKQADAIVENGNAELERERIRAFADIRQQVADLAIMAATRVIGESMDDARQRGLVDQFINTVGAAPGGKAFSTNGASSTGVV